MKANQLKGKIIENGYSISTFSKEIPMAYRTLYGKLRSGNFKCDEVCRIAELLNLSKEETINIFLN